MTDDQDRVIYSSGKRDEKQFIEPGTFLFKAEPVDQHGNLIDRHNLWEMVGVRYRRALFPGYSDSVQFMIECPSALALSPTNQPAADKNRDPEIEVPAPDRPAKQMQRTPQFMEIVFDIRDTIDKLEASIRAGDD